MSIQDIVPTNFNGRGGLAVYGPGTDGNVIITGTVVLNRDMYYNNLTVLGSAQLDTNGYRVFVKDTLNMADSSAVIGRLSDKTSAGSILGGAPSGIKASDTLGGDGGLNPGENFFGEAEFYNFSQAIAGYKFDAVEGTLRFLMGGSGGAIGESGSAGQSGSFTAGELGSPGSPGSPGSRPGFEYTVGASGGMGSSGFPGSAGSPGFAGLGGSGGLGGDGGAGGGVVIISARNIIGSGIIRADGESGSPGNPGGIGGPGFPGPPGSPGSPGEPAPDFYSASYLYVSTPGYNYSVEYSFTNPTTGGNAATLYNSPTQPGYNFIGSQGTFAYNSPVLSYNRPFYSYNRVTLYNSPTAYIYNTPAYNRPTTAYNRPTFNPRTPGPASVRWRPSNENPGTAFTVPGNQFFLTFLGYNPGTVYYTPGPSYEVIGNTFYTAGNIYAYIAYFPAFGYYFQPGNSYTVYNTIVPGNTSYAYNTEFEPDQFSIQPAEYFAGGAGGAGGLGGAGGIGSAGLPGSPGLNGYSGGGGVVLVVTESNIPDSIEVRAAAGTGDAGTPTSGTVIIIKNEAIDNAN
jgi:hypothetical protein